MTSEEVNRFLREQHTVEEYRDCLKKYFEEYIVSSFAKQEKFPYSDYVQIKKGKTYSVLKFEPRRKHKKRRVQKKWIKRYGYKMCSWYVFTVPDPPMFINYKIE